MGRKSIRPDAIPHLRARRKGRKVFFYYDHGGKPRREEPLGSDYGRAIQRWAEIERDHTGKPGSVVTFRYVADRYRAEVVPAKAPRTQRDNLQELGKLIAFFDDPPAPLDAIQPQHVRQYLLWRRDEAIEYWTEQNSCFADEEMSDDEVHKLARENAISLVDDIRKNRGIDPPTDRSTPEKAE